MHEWYVVSYVYVAPGGFAPQRLTFRTEKFGLPQKVVDNRPLPMRFHSLMVEHLGTIEVAVLNFWKVEDADGPDV